MNETITVDLFFHDEQAIRIAGVAIPNPAQVQVMRCAVPSTGDALRFSGANYQTGELAIFQVVSRAHLLGGENTQRIQLNLALRILHQP
ncbi:hypothetical protein GALL_71620 [mine drainage metagenome]|uniref:Uncharacterized protein n=1 Tax=mine drainage metagenome TaxID=410659 RepID=A0A1J5SRB7_9ZZZZ